MGASRLGGTHHQLNVPRLSNHCWQSIRTAAAHPRLSTERSAPLAADHRRFIELRLTFTLWVIGDAVGDFALDGAQARCAG
jgi:hypothetical protein